MSYYGFPQSRSKAEKLADAEKARKTLAAKGVTTAPVIIEGMKIAKTFWGKAWCDNIEAYEDFAYRLDRGRSYVRSGCVVDLKLEGGVIKALVQGSSLYTISVAVAPLPAAEWASLRSACFGKIDSLLSLLAGKLSDEVMRLITRRPGGLFPAPKQITMKCSCPDYAGMCKHVAAAMYGIGHRLDTAPEMLFALRGIDHRELIKASAANAAGMASASTGGDDALAADNLGALFGIELDDDTPPPPSVPATKAKPSPAKKSVAKPKPAAKLAPVKGKAKATRKPARKATGKKPVIGFNPKTGKKVVITPAAARPASKRK